MNDTAVDLWLVRHGHALHHETGQLQWDEVPLTREGRAQAGRLAVRLAALDDVAALYTSPLPRAWDTAVPISTALLLPPIPLPGLREIDFGQAGGMTVAEFEQHWPELADQQAAPLNMEFCWPGGESRGEFRRRSVQVMEALVWSHPGQRLVVVAHTGIVCGYLAHLLVGDAGRWRDFAVRPASLSRVEVSMAGARLLLHDDVAHLED